MDYKKHIENVRNRLSSSKALWNREVLNFYPDTLADYPEEWLESIGRLSKEQLWQLDIFNNYNDIDNPEMVNFFKQIEEITDLLPKNDLTDHNLPHWAFVGVGEKKRHEIICFSNLVNELNRKYDFKHVVDLGGGIGHLCRVLAHYFQVPTISIDQNAQLQQTGKLREKKYPTPENALPIGYINIDLSSLEKHELLQGNTLTIGLHTCGPLAVNHLKMANQSNAKGVINFGCCYMKLDPQKDINISNFARQNPLDISYHALTLASRSHSEISYEDFLLKERVKTYRYNLHLLLYHELGIKKFIGIGNSPKRYYRGSFADYASMNLERANIKHNLAEKTLNAFFEDPRIEQLIARMFFSNIIRWKFGRLLEHYILTDRCIYLEEQGYNTTMQEYFSESISPRNIGIVAIKE